jgi:hypothetical protein
MVVSGQAPITPPISDDALAQLRLRYRLAIAAADAYVAAGFTTVVQDVIVGPVLAEVVEMVRSQPLHVVVLAPRPDVVAARELARDKVAYAPGGFTVEQLDSALREDTPRIGMWLDTSDQTPSETVDEILRRTSA